ncbi:hypothetical protein E2C01_010832 [Portunus trituberculatus]|uniref:Uncharacterized protein n=1 Tax=Portunus trituberculatus TaxID=210409 RepID=A0A5B7D9G3_PORTR|nr:hypothetical protein [Portunus trituberculatus]
MPEENGMVGGRGKGGGKDTEDGSTGGGSFFLRRDPLDSRATPRLSASSSMLLQIDFTCSILLKDGEEQNIPNRILNRCTNVSCIGVGHKTLIVVLTVCLERVIILRYSSGMVATPSRSARIVSHTVCVCVQFTIDTCWSPSQPSPLSSELRARRLIFG